MLHDSLSSGMSRPPGTGERRHGVRAPVEAEVVIRWQHDLRTAVRYPVADLGEGGLRIYSAMPLLRDMLGIAVRLLPAGKPVNRPCAVSWCRPSAPGGPWEVGLRFG